MTTKNLQNLEPQEQIKDLVRNGIVVAMKRLTNGIKEIDAAIHRLEGLMKDLEHKG